jgi:hypothetical protein
VQGGIVITKYDEQLVGQLITAAGTLATVSDQASTLLSAEFETLVRPQVENVRAILAQLPTEPDKWDGELHDQDLLTTYKSSPHDTSNAKTGVHILHKPTGIGRESLSKPSQLENRTVAYNALKGAVAKEYTSYG